MEGNATCLPSDGLGGVLVDDGVEDGAGAVAREREKAGGHFVKNDAQGKEVGSGIEWLAEDLFRRHVGNGAYGAAWAC
jgi:hypothetical protein